MNRWGIIFSLFFLFVSCHIHAVQLYPDVPFGVTGPLKIATLTDVHYLAPQLAEEGKALFAFEEATGRKTHELHEVLDKVLADLGRETPQILLITGDLTNHGERQSHLAFIELLRPLQKAGTRIFVIPGNHDVNIPDARAYKGDTSSPVEGITPGEFARFYGEFGYDKALSRDSASLSYLAEIDEKTWLLCIDSNRYQEYQATSISAGRILPETLAWALQILREAKEKGITVLGMMHHGLVEHMPNQEVFFPDYLVDDWKVMAGRLADAGLGVIFTGHFHANDITLFTSPEGNRIFDVETASLAQYPFAYRIMQLQEKELTVDTRFVTSIPGNPNLESESRNRLEMLTRRAAKQRLNIPGLPIPEKVMESLIEMIVQLNLMHVRGNETDNPRLQESIALFGAMMGTEAEKESLSFDLPPADNSVILTIGEN
ncbi:MAG: metallophosphoesterase [Porphyromonadaceae bacterium]|nr:metallophosphoesterase [Porphyromonadaceae bacterium]